MEEAAPPATVQSEPYLLSGGEARPLRTQIRRLSQQRGDLASSLNRHVTVITPGSAIAKHTSEHAMQQQRTGTEYDPSKISNGKMDCSSALEPCAHQR